MSTLTLEQLHTFHAQERNIFSKLVLNYSRPPAESLLVMATWLWLEDFGYENIFSTIIALPDPYIVELAKEAVSCFQCLDSNNPPNDFNQIPLTARFMEKNISLPMIYHHRYSAITGIKNFLTTVCSRIFSDILQHVLPSSSSSSSFLNGIHQPLIIPGFPHPTFGGINVMPQSFMPQPDVVVGDKFPNNLFLIPSGLWGWNTNCIATQNDRTMFITFSRGFPVTKAEVKKLFTMMYGENCVEGIFMGEDNKLDSDTIGNSSGQQPLFARLVLDSVATVDYILGGEGVKKFRIHGKHIWARKYEERE